MCVCTSLYLIPPLPISIAAAAETHLAGVIPYVSSLLNVMPQVFEKFYNLTSLYFSYHLTSEQYISPEPETAYWQCLTANPDRPHKVFCQIGFCNVHIQAPAVFTMGNNGIYRCLV